MIGSPVAIHLTPALFDAAERTLLEYAPLAASVFRFESGVCALRLKNELGELVLLPFQGQQIWSAVLRGRNLTMRSMFTQPKPTRHYLENYGGFLLHCGVTAMGVPSAQDVHPLHGELPNAPYDTACLIAGEDERGAYLALSGGYQHTVAFNHNYRFVPEVRLYAGSSLFTVSFTLTNLKHSPMQWMYLAHINFRPADHARLIYSAPCTPEHVRVRTSIPSHIHPAPGYTEFLYELQHHPERHHLLVPGLQFDPEVVFMIDYSSDAGGWAHSLQVHPDGSADYVRHRPAELDKGIRWICRTADQDALGLVLPATAEPEGFLAEQAKGNLRTLLPGESFSTCMEMGVLTPKEAQEMERHIISGC